MFFKYIGIPNNRKLNIFLISVPVIYMYIGRTFLQEDAEIVEIKYSISDISFTSFSPYICFHP